MSTIKNMRMILAGGALLALSAGPALADNDGPMIFTVDTVAGTTSMGLSVSTAGRCGQNAFGTPVTLGARRALMKILETAPQFSTVRCEVVRAWAPLPLQCNLMTLKRCEVL